MRPCQFRRSVIAIAAITFAPLPAQAEQWQPDVMAGVAPVSVMVRHYFDGLEVSGPTGIRAVVFTINGQSMFKGDKAKLTVTTTTQGGKIVSRVYLFDDIGSGPLNVSFRIGGGNPQFNAIFAQLKNATSVHAVVNIQTCVLTRTAYSLTSISTRTKTETTEKIEPRS